ncbi:hypothetical protein EVAR_38990_1 [Eumeta japonica]|uniref:Uncharacterized protein n=1 Tax=Eumeta variegata TaxID=151549 RepID=A0A4C1W7P7_EUMVA|nr:hypothetical protein EVAR_38990_1 [Eumeta japonica]
MRLVSRLLDFTRNTTRKNSFRRRGGRRVQNRPRRALVRGRYSRLNSFETVSQDGAAGARDRLPPPTRTSYKSLAQCGFVACMEL